MSLIEPGRTIGQGAVNDLVIDEKGVNGFHADIKVSGDSITITDVNTASGTFVNGEQISGERLIGQGDVINIGGVELEIFSDDDSKTLVLSGTALMEIGAGSWSLTADSGPEKGQIIPVRDRIEIGRALDCDISLLEPALSRKHAELELLDDGLALRDLGSVNGTYVNGEKIDSVYLEDGDILQFGKIRFIVNAP